MTALRSRGGPACGCLPWGDGVFSVILMETALAHPRGGYLDRPPSGYISRPAPAGLADVINVILDKGLVIDAYIRVSLVGIELLNIDARIVVASVDTYLRFAEAVDRLSLGGERENEKPGLPQLVEDLGNATSKRKLVSPMKKLAAPAKRAAASTKKAAKKAAKKLPAPRAKVRKGLFGRVRA
jgi:gas vesicle structural protein